jgi:hypothetical protein
MPRRTPAIFALVLMLSGCASSPGTLVATQSPGGVPSVGKAQQDGAYGLFVAGESEPVFAASLHQGDSLGFQQAPAATVGSLQVLYLYAVYGDNRFRLDTTKTYEWRWLYAPKSK